MKTTNKIQKAILVIGLSLSALIAKPNNSPDQLIILETEKTIKESVKFPSNINLSNQKVEILFTTNLKGDVNFVLAKTTNNTLKNEIEKQFYNMHLTKLKNDVVHSIVLNFKTI
jgi:hypothetical protein